MKNPSTADQTVSDPTTRNVEKWAREHHYTHVRYLNLFARRASKPKNLMPYAVHDMIGPENEDILRHYVSSGCDVVLGWGGANGIRPSIYQSQIIEVMSILSEYENPLFTVSNQRTVKGKHPFHGSRWLTTQDTVKYI